ncbi:hypothetical protein QBC33DRAFT_582734 [Phialemonium atrogriseum]|uniref:Uncharacterized protein n=1 Tax=Phialemonium atrogriseum TaxID=1093897 RepID=A0AAJ0CBJ1_9PEZI|nr:uncharacterized protein QBC33DRAFT_582734 [Phialemonium atrogriseum]KAK1772252.1 hypothetical protein QBC33DRAFT_582734 [Phialemonium atrogriseum]
MPLIPGSVHDMLARPHPVLRENSKHAVNKNSTKWEHMTHFHLSHWKDFTFVNLYNAFSHILRRPVGEGQFPGAALPSSYNVQHKSEVKSVSSTYLETLLHAPIVEGVSVLRESSPPSHIPSVTIMSNQLVHTGEPRFQSSLSFLAESNPRANLVVSCTRLAQAWHSDDIIFLLNGDKNMNPMRQVASYGVHGDTRYAFILTNEEVVVVRFFRSDDPETSHQCRAEWRSIPWDASGERVLTPALAIWFLVMMSLHREHRPIRTRRETLPVNLWWTETGDKGEVTYTHHLSLRKTDTRPPGAEFRDRPSE